MASKGEGADSTLPALTIFRTLEDARDRAHREHRNMTILFSDLCDSTPFKVLKGRVDGLRKTYVHNETVADAAARHNGKVVKFIGDEVMATFEGDDGPIKAVFAAIDLQRAFLE